MNWNGVFSGWICYMPRYKINEFDSRSANRSNGKSQSYNVLKIIYSQSYKLTIHFQFTIE